MVAVQSQSLFGDPAVPQQSLITTQMNPSAPSIVQLQTTTNGLIADSTIMSRLDHFPEDLYDLRGESHLVRFMAALLGDPGAGQLRKRYLLQRIQTVLDSAVFFDLDGFYGAIFGSTRNISEAIPANPYMTNATPDAWDEILGNDARYRERILALAAAIPMAGTLSGIRQAAEALVGAECEVYEMWRFMDADTGAVVTGPTWDEVEAAYATWNDIEGIRWNVLDPTDFSSGNLGVTSAAEVVIHPKKDYPPGGSVEQALDEYALVHVLGILRPANVVISVDFVGVEVHQPVPIGSVASDSNFWEIITKVIPNFAITLLDGLYPLAPSQIAAGVTWGELRTLPRPPLITTQGLSWEQASAVVSTSASAIEFPDGADITQPGSGSENALDPMNFQTVAHFDGTSTQYSAERGVADPKSVQGGVSAAGGILMASPYAAPRTTVVGA